MPHPEAVAPRASLAPHRPQWARGAALLVAASALAAVVYVTSSSGGGAGPQTALYQSGAEAASAGTYAGRGERRCRGAFLSLLWTRLTSACIHTEAKRLTYLHDPTTKGGIINDLSRVIEAAPDEKADDPTRRPQLLISGEEAESQAKPLRPGGLGVWLNRGNTPDHNVWSLNYMDERTNAHYGQAANTHHDWYQPGVIAPDKDVPHSMYYNVLEHWTGHDPMAPPYEATRPPPPPPIPPAPAAAAGSGAGSGSGAEGGCPADFPFQDNNVPLCWKTSDLQAAGTGPCGTWCTKDVAAGGGCGDNADHLCS